MKKLLIAIALICGLFLPASSSAQTQWFSVHASGNVSPLEARVGVTNRWGRQIYCRGRVWGITRSGHYVYSNMNGWVYPGRTGWVYVYTSAPNYFVSANGRIQCRF
jgi:hypothetical protein